MQQHLDSARPAQPDADWRAGRPLNGPGPYAVQDGRVLTDGLEVVVTGHCNLRCRACAYLSPAMPATIIPPGQVSQDLTTLARFFHASEARVLGGEPLLHPELTEVLGAVRESGISDTIRVITNGLLLGRMPALFWTLVDEVSISVYPGREPDHATVTAAQSKAEEHGIRLRLKHFRYFRESYSEPGTGDRELIGRIYRTCQMANVWRCNTVMNGHLYRCPQSAFLPPLVHPRHSIVPTPEGLPIHDTSGFAGRLLKFLELAEPLGACAHCLGSVGRLFSHVQVARPQWRSPQQHGTEELIDWKHLDLLEHNPGIVVRDTSYLPAQTPDN